MEYPLLKTRLRCFTTFFRWSGLWWMGIFGWWYTYRIHHILIPFNIPGFFIRNKEIVLRGDPSRGGCESTGTTYAFIWCVVSEPKYNPRLDTMQDRCVSIRYDTIRYDAGRMPAECDTDADIERFEKDRYAIRYDDKEYDADRKLTGSCNLKSRDITKHNTTQYTYTSTYR